MTIPFGAQPHSASGQSVSEESPVFAPDSYTHQVQDCLQLARDVDTHELAAERYQALRDRLIVEQPDTVGFLDAMWNDLLKSRRVAAMWERMCQTEQQVADQMAERHVQLSQNYLRLVQEQ